MSMELSVLKIDGTESGKKVTLNEQVFGLEPNDHAIYLDVKQYLANQRQGTHKSKERWEVAYSTKKIVRQKGSGGARHGSIKSPTFVGGGRVFGPRPRDYRFKINKKVKMLARKLALTSKVQNNELIVVENFTFEAPKTKNYIDFAKNLKIEDKKVLLVLSEANNNVYLSLRNVPNAKMMQARDLNTYAILNNNALVLTEDSVNQINEL